MATNDHHCLLHNIMVCKIDGFYIFSSKSWIYLYFSHIMFCTLSNIGSFRNPFPFRSENSERSPKFWDFHFRHVGRSLPHSGADCKRLQSFLPIGPFVDRWAAKLEMKWVWRRKRNTEMSIVHVIHKHWTGERNWIWNEVDVWKGNTQGRNGIYYFSVGVDGFVGPYITDTVTVRCH